MEIFFNIAVVEGDIFWGIPINVFLSMCQTKFFDYARKPYNISITTNVVN